ncbi:MAG TPA: DUF3500 domain-containing protein [Verrucomicrobiales bacterium]|nr:DUF3500 domain-containing protein [Verrucomicrobiales bacterium]
MNAHPSCPDCSDSSPLTNRRSFLKTSAGLLAASALPVIGEEKPKATGETLTTQLYKSLTEEQRKKICFAWDNPLRSKVDNNWMIVADSIADLFKPDQQALIHEIFHSLHSEEYKKIVYDQVVHDSGDEGFDKSTAIAIFGEPGTGKFELVLTGRHVTRRCDGDSIEGTAFGGPIFYGHAAESFNEKADHPGNAYWYQAKRANEVFKALDGKQREQAMIADGRPEKGTDTVKLTGKKEGLSGIPVGTLSADQKDLVKKVLADLLAPFRKADADEAMKLITARGIDELHMAFSKKGDIGNDGVWDVWQIEGPNMFWYFRGAPHVHAWAHIKA